jgi:hypothetical protein
MVFNVYSFGDRDWPVFSGCELAWFLMCTLLVTQTVACLVSVGELAWAFIVLSCCNMYFGAFF